jgi:heme-degrading monooxygenase HmoA
MILEIADIKVKPGHETAFEQAAHHGIQTIIATTKGFLNYQIQHSIESPQRYVLLLEWETVEDHTIGFRASPAYAQWQSLVSGCLAQPPAVEHFNHVRSFS